MQESEGRAGALPAWPVKVPVCRHFAPGASPVIAQQRRPRPDTQPPDAGH